MVLHYFTSIGVICIAPHDAPLTAFGLPSLSTSMMALMTGVQLNVLRFVAYPDDVVRNVNNNVTVNVFKFNVITHRRSGILPADITSACVALYFGLRSILSPCMVVVMLFFLIIYHIVLVSEDRKGGSVILFVCMTWRRVKS